MDEIRFIGEWSIVKKERQGGSSRRGTDIYINGKTYIIKILST